MKVYVVTCGCYSDYHIVGVFTDKDKAEEYVRVNNECSHSEFDAYDVEVYDSMDDTIITKCFQLDFRYAENEVPRITINRVPSDEYSAFTSFTELPHSQFAIWGCRSFLTNNIDEDLLKAKYEKYCYDLMAFCKELDAEGLNEKEIQQMVWNREKEVND